MQCLRHYRKGFECLHAFLQDLEAQIGMQGRKCTQLRSDSEGLASENQRVTPEFFVCGWLQVYSKIWVAPTAECLSSSSWLAATLLI